MGYCGVVVGVWDSYVGYCGVVVGVWDSFVGYCGVVIGVWDSSMGYFGVAFNVCYPYGFLWCIRHFKINICLNLRIPSINRSGTV